MLPVWTPALQQGGGGEVKVFLIRHGKAEERSHQWDEWERPLTAKGQQETERTAARLMELGVRFDRLLSSPLARARETAEILLEAGLARNLEFARFLEPGGGFAELEAFLAGCSPDETVALVGHLPDLPGFAEVLVWGRVVGGLVMKKGAILGISVPPGEPLAGQGNLFWLTSPRLLFGP